MRVLILSASLLVAGGAHGQTMYRCGSVYQDRPCAAGTAGKALGSTSSADPAPAADGDADCVQRARDSNRVVWAREGGASEERLLSEAKSEGERRAQGAERGQPSGPSRRGRIGQPAGRRLGADRARRAAGRGPRGATRGRGAAPRVRAL